jgi:hypothetical protein
MPLYHYLLPATHGRIVTTVSVEHRTDSAARTAAAQMLPWEGVHRIEIWQGDRRIKHADDG